MELVIAAAIGIAALVVGPLSIHSPGRAAVLTVLCLTAAVMIRLDQRYPLTAALVMIGATAIALVTSNIKLADRFATVSIALLACTLVLSFGVSFRSAWAHRFRRNAAVRGWEEEEVDEGFQSFARDLFAAAEADNLEQIRGALSSLRSPDSGRTLRILDLGCWDGHNARYYSPEGAEMHGMELDRGVLREARSIGIRATCSTLNADLPIRDESFDAISSNQVIEHLSDTDIFLAESFRVLRPGGHVVVSTENMSSWHNLAALLLGWQAFSLTNITDKRSGIGNPMALLRDTEPVDKGWEHHRIFSYRGLKELLEAHGFIEVRILGAGYYPLPSRVAHWDPRHAAFITAVGRKPERRQLA